MVAMTTVNAVRRTLQDYSPLFYTFSDLISRASRVLARLHGQQGGNIKVAFHSKFNNNFEQLHN